MDQLSETFGALADPTRRAILARLALGETSVTDLASPFDMSMPAISRHLKVLEKAGLISRGREAQWRPCRLRGEAMKDAASWLEQYRRFWEESLDKLEAYLEVMKREQVEQKAQSAAPVAAASAATEDVGAVSGEKADKKRRKQEKRLLKEQLKSQLKSELKAKRKAEKLARQEFKAKHPSHGPQSETALRTKDHTTARQHRSKGEQQ